MKRDKNILALWLLSCFIATSLLSTKVVKTTPTKKLQVVTTLSVLSSLVSEIGGDRVTVSSLSSAVEDPHFVKAKPTFKRLVSEADLFVQIGRSLELWAPLVLNSAANPKLAGDGVLMAASGVKALEAPSALTRERGDIHPEGNPHVWLSPTAVLKMAENIKNALIAKAPSDKLLFEKNYLAFKKKLSEALFGPELLKSSGSLDFLWRLHEGKKLNEYLNKRKKSAGGWLKKASAIDYPIITYHTVWSYLADDFNLKIFDQIEEKSGVAPSLKYQNQLVNRAKASGVKHVVAASYYKGSAKLIELLANKIGGKKVFIDVDRQANESYIGMIDRIIAQLLELKAPQQTVLKTE